jgi:hypothetical protein
MKFDLNIGNYNVNELEELFDLGGNYDTDTINKREHKLSQNISKDKKIEPDHKANILQFITQAKQIMINSRPRSFIPMNTAGTRHPANKTNSTDDTLDSIYNLDYGLSKASAVDAGNTTIVKQTPTPFVYASVNDYNRGSINPLDIQNVKKHINIDTRFRENYYATTSTNFHMTLPIKLSKVVSLDLAAMELPNTFYAVSKVLGNNTFVLEILDEPPLLVSIPDGNYDYLSLQNYLNNYLSSLEDSPYNEIEFLADINKTGGAKNGSGKMVVGSKLGELAFSINFLVDSLGNEDKLSPLPLKFGWLMGFRAGYYENALTYVSEGIIDLTGPNYIYLAVDDFNNSYDDGFYGSFNASLLNKNIMARISLQGSVFNYSSSNNSTVISSSRQYFGPVDIQKLQIQLLDEYGRILNLNNMDYSFCLTFQTLYDL